LFTDEACFIRDGIFNNHNSHTWAEGKICGQRLWGAMYATFWMGLVCYPYVLVHIFTGRAWRNYHQNCWGISSWQSRETRGSRTTGLRLILPVTSENLSPPLTAITGLDRAGLLLGFPVNRTSHHWASSYGATWQTWSTHPVDYEEYIIAVSLSQQQPSGKKKKKKWDFWTHHSFPVASLSALYRVSWPYVGASVINW
jgi:hypothetical protein